MTRLLGSVRALVRDRFCYLITQSRKTEANLLTERSREVMFPLLKRLYFCEPSSGRSSAGSIAAGPCLRRGASSASQLAAQTPLTL